MKLTINISALVIFIFGTSSLFGYLHDWSYNEEKAKVLTEESVYVFDGKLEILKREYRDRMGFSVTNEEALKGKRRGQHSIRINQQWRICFKWHARNVEIVDYH